jgi:hypothetical protein
MDGGGAPGAFVVAQMPRSLSALHECLIAIGSRRKCRDAGERSHSIILKIARKFLESTAQGNAEPGVPFARHPTFGSRYARWPAGIGPPRHPAVHCPVEKG